MASRVSPLARAHARPPAAGRGAPAAATAARVPPAHPPQQLRVRGIPGCRLPRRTPAAPLPSLPQAAPGRQRLQVGLAFLGTVGSTAPFVGLFGTVWGIYHALTAIGIAGQASIDKVAGPVGESLIMTAIGLAVAVPAVLGYNWLVRRNKNAMAHVHAFAADLEKCLLGGNKPKSLG